MARVNVDSQALTDARFAVLANLMGSDDPDLALGRMIRVWMQCIERETYVVTKPVIVALFRGAVDAPQWLVNAELAEEINGGIRIKGTKGRIEYLAMKRASARENGRLGGRPKGTNGKTKAKPTPVIAITPPAPAPAPALKENPLPLFPSELDSPEFRTSWTAWERHRREINKRLKPTMVSRQLAQLAVMGRKRAIACIEHTITMGWTGLREPESNAIKNSVPNLSEQQRAEKVRRDRERNEREKAAAVSVVPKILAGIGQGGAT